MAIYLIGDIQGCFQELKSLLSKVNFDPKTDQIWPCGDLVARGPDSLETLRFIKQLGDSAKVVLGNHDLHLLATYAGLKKPKANDKLEQLLNAPDAKELLDWLAQQPLVRQLPDENAYLSHAGIAPEWSLTEALEQAEKAQQKIASSDRNTWLACMYGNTPNSWRLATTEEEQFRFTINAFTRMRMCFSDGSLEFNFKGNPDDTIELLPWYMISPSLDTTPWVFGHWASINGQCPHPNGYALDTGCVWGGELTMLRWHDKQYFSVPAQK